MTGADTAEEFPGYERGELVSCGGLRESRIETEDAAQLPRNLGWHNAANGANLLRHGLGRDPSGALKYGAIINSATPTPNIGRKSRGRLQHERVPEGAQGPD